MSKQPLPGPTANAVGHCPTTIQISQLLTRPDTGSLPSTIAPPNHPIPHNVCKNICIVLRLKHILYWIISGRQVLTQN